MLVLFVFGISKHNNKMKYIVQILAAAILIVSLGGCKYDDSELTGRVDNLENRVTALEELCKQMNTNITSL